MNVLLTGGTGNLGSRLAVPLIQRGDNVVSYDVKSEPHFSSAEFNRVKCVLGNLADRGALSNAVESHDIQSIFHLGAVLSASAEEHPNEAWRANMNGMINVLEAARLASVQTVIFTSTIATYGDRLACLTDETPQWPVSLYGVTKVAGERLGVYYHHRFNLDFRGIRLPAILAPRGSSGGTSAYCSAVFEEAVRTGAYEFYVEPKTRAPVISIADAVRGLIRLHDAPAEDLSRRVYNVFAVSPSAEELAALAEKHVPGVRITYKPDPLRNAIVKSWPHQIDDSTAKRDWHWEPTTDLDIVVREIVEELRR